MSNTKPIGVAYLDQDIIGADYIYSANELGYTAAATGSVTQATSQSTTGQATITLRNITAGPLSEAVVFNYVIVHGGA
mgnify:CR=1 FL=1